MSKQRIGTIIAYFLVALLAVAVSACRKADTTTIIVSRNSLGIVSNCWVTPHRVERGYGHLHFDDAHGNEVLVQGNAEAVETSLANLQATVDKLGIDLARCQK